MLGEIVIPKSVDEVGRKAFSYIHIEPRGIRLAFLGTTTKFNIGSNIGSNGLSEFEGTIYCLPGSEIQKQARQRGLEVRPLSEFEAQ